MNTSRIYEPEIIINPDTRIINIPHELYNIGVVSDNNAEVVKIRIPRYFDGCDFSTRTCTISYNNALKERSVYKVKEMDVDENSLLLSWYISNQLTKKSGKVYFVVEFKKDVDERGMSYSWSTLPAELNVLAGLDDDIAIDESDISLYRSLLSSIQSTDRRVYELIQMIGQITNSDEKIELLTTQVNSLQQNINSMQENIAYLEPDEVIMEE